MAADPAAMQLRLLQTVTEVAAEKNSTLVMPFPVELLRFFEHASGGAPGAPAAPPGAELIPLAELGDQADAEVAALDIEPLDVPPVELPPVELPSAEVP